MEHSRSTGLPKSGARDNSFENSNKRFCKAPLNRRPIRDSHTKNPRVVSFGAEY